MANNFMISQFPPQWYAQRQVKRMREYFLDWPGDFEFKGALAAGWGQTSVIVAVMERSPNPAMRKPRGFIVKRSYQEAVFNPEHDEILQREIDAVYRMRGMVHIARPYFPNPNPLYALSRPSLVVEWVENGPLKQFYDRVVSEEMPIPNRMLFHFFACLMRMCIAMAWPDNPPIQIEAFDLGIEFPNETFPSDPKPPKSQWVHGNVTMNNIMIGDHSPLADEHILTPILKLIDFGALRIDPNTNNDDAGTKQNIYDMGRIMRILITQDDEWDPAPDDVTMSIAGTNKTFQTAAAVLIPDADFLNIDADLRRLVMRCQAVNAADRPTLEQLGGELVQHMTIKTEDYYKSNNLITWRLETTSSINEMINELIYYA